MDKPQARRRAIFIHINKTGGSSIEKALGIPLGHFTVRQAIERMGKHRWQQLYSFTIVRNPWDKVLSQYCYRVQTNQTGLAEQKVDFNQWVTLSYGQQNPQYYNNPMMFMPQCDWLKDCQQKIPVSFIGRFERLSDEFSRICDSLDISAALPHLKSSRHRQYHHHYNQQGRDIISRHFAEDIDTFGYRFEDS